MIGWGMVGGLQGPTGADGDDGADGPEGPEGPAGPAGDFSAVPTGSVAEPGLGFDGEATTGLSRPSAGVFAFSTLGTRRAEISDSGLALPTAHNLSLYNTSDETTNYERGGIVWSGNYFVCGPEKAGTGQFRGADFGSWNGLIGAGTFTGMQVLTTPVVNLLVNNGIALKVSGDGAQLIDGSVGAPGLSFQSETTTGLYRISAGVLGIAVGGAEKFRIDGGSVILNQGGASFVAHTSGGYYFVGNGATGMLAITNGLMLTDSNGQPKFKVDNTGVGFNGTAPIAKPTVTGSAGGNAALASLLTALANYGLITDSSS